MNESQINMRIAMRAQYRCKITTQSIDSVPDIQFFIESEINKNITQGCKEVLRASLNSKTHQHGEYALLISTLENDIYGNTLEKIHKIWEGNHTKVHLDKEFSNIIVNRTTKDLILIHNHPNNGTFSYGDLKALSRNKNLLAIIAIGNTRNMYLALDEDINNKIINYVERQYQLYIAKNNISKIEEKQARAIKDKIVSKYVLTNPNSFSMIYEKYRRRSLW